MKVSGIWVLCMLVGTALMLLHFSCGLTSLSIADFVFTDSNGSTTMVPTSRKLKENGYVPSMGKRSDTRNVNLEDYRPINPVPSSKASIRPGPIEHGTPLNPFIPKPSPPPGRPKNGGFY